MSTIIFAVLPVFATIVAGFFVNKTGILSNEFWFDANKLVYWFLFPAFLFHKTSSISLGELSGSGFVLALLGAYLLCLSLMFLISRVFGSTAASTSSLLQGSSRHNTFIALAIAEPLFGETGLALAAVATAALIPLTNLTIIPIMTALLQGGRGARTLTRNMARELLRNPFILSIGLGISFNLSHINEIPLLTDCTALIGRAALPMVLLCIGASLGSSRSETGVGPLLTASAVKLIAFPSLTAFAIAWFELPVLEGMVLMLYAALPTSSAAYALARQMGGDATLMANMITFQTALSLISLPATLWLAAQWLHFSF